MPEFPADRDCGSSARGARKAGSKAVAKIRNRDAVGHESLEVDSLTIESDPGAVD